MDSGCFYQFRSIFYFLPSFNISLPSCLPFSSFLHFFLGTPLSFLDFLIPSFPFPWHPSLASFLGSITRHPSFNAFVLSFIQSFILSSDFSVFPFHPFYLVFSPCSPFLNPPPFFLCVCVLTSRAKGSFRMRRSVDFWNLRISSKAFVPGRYRWRRGVVPGVLELLPAADDWPAGVVGEEAAELLALEGGG